MLIMLTFLLENAVSPGKNENTKRFAITTANLNGSKRRFTGTKWHLFQTSSRRL